MTKSGEAGKDFVGRFGPHKGFGTLVMGLDVANDGAFQSAGAAVDTAPNLFLGQHSEPALHQVNPGSSVGLK